MPYPDAEGLAVLRDNTRERCSYVWERRTPGKRYVNARGRCKRNATASDGRCAEHCSGDIAPGVRCEHDARRRYNRA